MDEIRILIVDDHALFRQGVRKMLEMEDDFLVVGEASTGKDAFDQAMALMPDVVLMDIKMPDIDGVEVTRNLCRDMPHVKILFCTMYEDDEFVFAGLKAGGRGYIVKESNTETMIRAIRAVANGEVLLSPGVAEKVLRLFSNVMEGRSFGIKSPYDHLTERELEVLTLIGKGNNNRQIAGHLSISEKTVKNHISNIFSKLHICDRTQAVIYAIRNGLVKI